MLSCLAWLCASPGLLQAGNDTWVGNTSASWNASNWSGANNPPAAGDSLFFGAAGSSGTALNNNFAAGTSFAGLTFISGASAFNFTGNQLATTSSITDNSLNLETINLPIALASASHSLSVVGGGSLLVGGVISGAGYGITLSGEGLVTLTNANTYTGPTAINAGQLTLDFYDGGLANNIISGSSVLSLGGGSLYVKGSTTISNTQSFASATVASGPNTITIAPASGTNQSATITLGAITYDVGASLVVNGLAYSAGASSSAGQSGAYGSGTTSGFIPATGLITTTSGTANSQLTGNTVTAGSSTAQYGAFITIGLYDYATVVNTSPFTIIGASQGTAPTGAGAGANGTDGDYTLVNAGTTGGGSGSSGGPWDLVGNCSGHNTDNMTALRFNSPGAATFSIPSGTTIQIGGVLVTPNVGSANITVSSTGTASLNAGLRSSNPGSVVTWQNNTNGLLIYTCPLSDGKAAGSVWVQAGLSTVEYMGVNTYGGATYLNGGVSEIMADSGLGSVGNGSTVYLNGGTILGATNLTLDNAGANKRPISLGSNGGALASATGYTLTVDGTVGGAGQLIVGIPAEYANGEIAGLAPGTGGASPNPPVYATGTVALTASNTFTGGTILDSGILKINGLNAIGANSGGLTLNGGTLQYSPSFTGNGIGDLTYGGGLAVASGGGTIDLAGNNVTFTNAIGGTSGLLTVINSSGSGVLTLLSPATFTGGATISNATVLANNTTGSALGSGYVAVAAAGVLGGNGSESGTVEIQYGGTLSPGNGAVGTNTIGSLLLDYGATNNFQFGGSANSLVVVTTSGGLNLNGGIVNLYAGGSTPFASAGTYKLFQFSGSLGGSVANLAVGNPQTGYTYTFGTSGNYVTLTIGVVSSLDIGVWTASANGNWSAAANWTGVAGTMPPHKAGDSATLGVSAALRTVTLDASESVGALNFTNANSFVIANAGKTLTLDNSGNGAAISVTGGTTNAIQAAVSLNDNTTVSVGAGDSLAVSANIGDTGGSETLNLNLAGTLVLSGNNAYGPAAASGYGTIISGGGVLQVGSNGALAAGDVSIKGAGATLQGGAPSVSLPNNFDIASSATATVNNNGDSITLSGNITDGGNLAKSGAGTLTLSGNNSYSGNTVINGGVLNLANGNAASATPNIILNGGDLLGSGTFGLNANLEVGVSSAFAGGTNALIDAASGQQLYLYGSLSSAGNSGTNNLIINSGAGDNGTVVLEGIGTLTGTTVIDNGFLQVANTLALQDSALVYNNAGGTLVFDPGVIAATIGSLIGNQNLALTNLASGGVSLTLGDGASVAYSGSFSDYGLGGAFTWTGGGTLLLSGISSYTGNTTVGSGVLQITNSGAVYCGEANTAAGDAGELWVDGGILVATNASTIGDDSTLLVSSGTATFIGGLSTTFNNDTPELIEITGGTLNAASISLGRNNLGYTTQPAGAVNTIGLYVDGGAVNITGNLDMTSSDRNNSTATARMDAGSLTVGGQVIIGLDNPGRWSVLDINGGIFTATNTSPAISVGGPYAGDGVLVIGGGTNFVNGISLGYNGVADTEILNQTNGILYLGAGGIYTPAGVTSGITNSGGTLAAYANWATTNEIDLYGTNYTFQTADASGNPWTIGLSGPITGPASGVTVTGSGVLVLSGVNTYTGPTIISNGVVALTNNALTGIDGSIADSANLFINAGATLDVSGIASKTVSLGSGYYLSGGGKINGTLNSTGGGKVAPGGLAGTANLTVTNSVALGGTTHINLNRTNSPTSDRITAPAIAAGGVLTVTNIGGPLHTGDTFTLFSTAVTGSFSTVSLPMNDAVNNYTYTWNNKLGVNGTIVVASAAPNVNLNPTNIVSTFANGVLTLTWPADHTGWQLQAQTNTLAAGLGANWVNVAGSTTTNQVQIPVSTANAAVFYRLFHP